MSDRVVGCYVGLVSQEGATFCVKGHHYEKLKDALDRHDKGFVELESAWGDGKHLIRMEDIQDLTLATESYVAERAAFELQHPEG